MSVVVVKRLELTDDDGDSFMLEELHGEEIPLLTLNVDGGRARNITKDDARALAAFLLQWAGDFVAAAESIDFA